MNLSQELVGHQFPPHVVKVDAGRLRFFAKAVGETRTEFTNRECERLPLPPTFLFCLDMDREDPFDFLTLTDVSIEKILHGEQEFRYHLPVFSGEFLRFESRVTDIYDKRGGALQFLVIATNVTRGGTLVAEMKKTVVIRPCLQ